MKNNASATSAHLHRSPRHRKATLARVADIADDLARAAHGHDVAWNFSSAVCALQAAVSEPEARISGEARDRLLEALTLARPALTAMLTASLDDQVAAKGVDAVAGLVILWSESGDERLARPAHVSSDLASYARVVRNVAHNISLLQEVAQRATDRRTKVVRNILRNAAA